MAKVKLYDFDGRTYCDVVTVMDDGEETTQGMHIDDLKDIIKEMKLKQ